MIFYLLYIGVLAFAFAKLEIQIEGTAGLAKNLPTWRIEDHWALKVFFGGRVLTGYHFWALGFVLLLFHLPLFFVSDFTWTAEAEVLGGLIIFWIVEDFLWFVINPGFGISKFKREHIPWHPRWSFGLPVDYWIFLPLGFYLVFIAVN